MTNPFLGIEVSAQGGDPESGRLYRPLHALLNKVFEKHCAKSYCPSVSTFSLILRISGKIWNFKSEGVERLRRNRKKQYITVDIVIPEKNWKGVSKEKLREDLAELVRDALEIEVARLKKDKETVDEEAFWLDVDKALDEFLAKPLA